MSTLKITLSGPAACGKSVVAKALAKLLKEAGHSVIFLDEYRRIDIDDLPELEVLVRALDLYGKPRLRPFDVVMHTEET